MTEYLQFVDYVRDTKIMEYRIAFVFIGLFAIYYLMLQPKKAAVAATESVMDRAIDLIKGFLLPAGLNYHQGPTWAKAEAENLAECGIDDFARKLVGPINKIELPKVGAALKQGERAWTLVVDGKAVAMLAPLDGEVVAVNDTLLTNPGALNKDPYNAGWLVKVQSPKIKANLKNLLHGELAQKWTEQAVEGLVTKANLALGAVAADGGVPVDGVARQLDAEHWDNIAKEYFLTD